MTPDDASLTLVIDGGLLTTFGAFGQQASASGLNVLLSGARATTGVVSGRYLYEVRIMDIKPENGRVRLGFGTADANIFVGSDALGWAIDAESGVWYENLKTPAKGVAKS